MSFLGDITAGQGSVISGLIGAGSSLLGGIEGAAGQSATNAQSLQEMYAQQAYGMNMQTNVMNYETQMSNTAYQRAVADMKAAGLNPILAASLGGASTPNVGIPSTGAPTLGNPGMFLGSGLTGAGQAVGQIPQYYAQLQQGKKDATASDLNVSTKGLVDKQGATQDEVLNRTKAETEKTKQDTATGAANARAADASAASSAADVILKGALTNSADANRRLTELQTQLKSQYGDSAWGHLFGTIAQTGKTLARTYSAYDASKKAAGVGQYVGGGLVKNPSGNTTFTITPGGGYRRD